MYFEDLIWQVISTNFLKHLKERKAIRLKKEVYIRILHNSPGRLCKVGKFFEKGLFKKIWYNFGVKG